MTKEELRKIVADKTAEEQEMIIDLLGEENLLAKYGEEIMVEVFTEANNERLANKIRNRTGCNNVTVQQVYYDGIPYHITVINNK